MDSSSMPFSFLTYKDSVQISSPKWLQTVIHTSLPLFLYLPTHWLNMKSPSPTSSFSPLLQPLLTASLSISFHSYEREQNKGRVEVEPLFSFELMGCLSPSVGTFCQCGSHTWTCLPTNRMEVCILVFLITLCPTLLTQKSFLSPLSALYAQKEILSSAP
jgi:hypothetical protein